MIEVIPPFQFALNFFVNVMFMYYCLFQIFNFVVFSKEFLSLCMLRISCILLTNQEHGHGILSFPSVRFKPDSLLSFNRICRIYVIMQDKTLFWAVAKRQTGDVFQTQHISIIVRYFQVDCYINRLHPQQYRKVPFHSVIKDQDNLFRRK